MALAASRMALTRPQGFHVAPVSVTRRTTVCVRAEKGEVVGKAVLVDKIAKEASLTKAQATKAFDTLIDAVQDAVASGQKVTVMGFGTFETRSRKERTGRNPKTGEPIEIAASMAPAFRPSSRFKGKVNGTPAPDTPKAAAPKAAAVKPAAVKPAAAKPAPPKAAAPLPAAPSSPAPGPRRAMPPPPKARK